VAIEKILSVGIDIGTSTTQAVFSSIAMDNTAGYFQVPRVTIVQKDVVYKSRIYETPLISRSLIDGEGVRKIVEGEFEKAGYRASDTQTGAVIITGEAARKENAAVVLDKLSSFAGEFVVSTAGPDLEAIIAGKGSGAWQHSLDENVPVVNLDIGGGTSNIVEFRDGKAVSKGCVDIGGRNIRFDGRGTVTHISEGAAAVIADMGLPIREGEKAEEKDLEKLCRRMAELLWELIGGRTSPLLEKVQTPGSSVYRAGAPKTVFFSGGVADCIYSPQDDERAYGDIGVLLGRAIRSCPEYGYYKEMKPAETIRATVVGAGSYMTSVSGSTIYYSRKELFPQKNLPVLEISDEWKSCLAGDGKALEERIRWFMNQMDTDRLMLLVPGMIHMGYQELKSAAKAVSEAAGILPEDKPLIICLEADYAKALGQTIRLFMKERDVICIDSLHVEQDDYVDIGSPIMNGIVVPVVIKTLIFG
jgi:ethanolamine utilization protein EutA